MRIVLIALSLFILACSKETSTSEASALSYPGGMISRVAPAGTKFLKVDTKEPIDGSENTVLVCLPGSGFCKSDCISAYFPEIERWSLFVDDYTDGGKSIAYAFAYPNESATAPRMKYWIGSFQYEPGKVTGRPVFDFETPNFEGFGYFEMVRIPEGQPSVEGRRVYYEHRWFDSDEKLVKTQKLENFNPPVMWSYTDTSVSRASITPQLVHGASCIKEAELGHFF